MGPQQYNAFLIGMISTTCPKVMDHISLPFFLHFGEVFTLPSLKAMLRLEREDMKTKKTQGREEGLPRAHSCQPDSILSRTDAERKL